MSSANRAYKASTRADKRAKKAGRDSGPFLALPRAVVESDGWRRASHTARSLLIDMANGALGRNGKLSASRAFLAPLGWSSECVVRRAVKDLMACGLLYETRMGRRPNVAACYAVTWMDIVDTTDLDPAAVSEFRRGVGRGAYMRPVKAEDKSQSRRTAAATAARQMQALASRRSYTPAPSDGAKNAVAAPSDGALKVNDAPSNGAIRGPSATITAPLDGAFLEEAICTSRVPPWRSSIGRVLAKRVKHGKQQSGYLSVSARALAANAEAIE